MNNNKSLYPVAIHLFFRKDNKILLLRRFNTGYEDGNYSVVAGHVDFNESVIQAGIREAEEEVGVTISKNNINIIGIMHRKSDDERVDFFANVNQWEGQITNMEPNKCDELRWCNEFEIPSNTIGYIKRALSLNNEKVWYDEFGW